MSEEIKTPRTDEEVLLDASGMMIEPTVVLASFARTLEIELFNTRQAILKEGLRANAFEVELAQVKGERDYLKQSGEQFQKDIGELRDLRDSLRQQLEDNQKILLSVSEISVESLRDAYLDLLKRLNKEHLPSEYKSWEDVWNRQCEMSKQLLSASLAEARLRKELQSKLDSMTTYANDCLKNTGPGERPYSFEFERDWDYLNQLLSTPATTAHLPWVEFAQAVKDGCVRSKERARQLLESINVK